MSFFKRFFCALCSFLCLQVASSQIHESVSFRLFDTRNGLPSTQIQGIFEDSKGFIWAITDRGAARYNGYEFAVYTTRNGMPTNNILLINEDRNGRVWFMCNNGDYCYLEGDTILPYAGNKKINSLLKDKLPGPFYFDEKDTLWITTFSGIQLFKCYGDSVSEFIPASQNPGDLPTYYLRKVGEKLVTLQVGETTENNRITTTDNINYLLDVAGECKLACSVEVEKDKWAVAGPGGFVIFDETGNVQAYFNSSPYLFSTLEHDRSGKLWLTISNGAYRLKNYRNGPQDADVFFEGHFITAVIQDRAGNYWFGDRDNGLFFVPSLDIKVFNPGAIGKQNKAISIRTKKNEIFYSDAEGKVYRINGKDAELVNENTVPSGVSLDFTFTAKGNIILGNNAHVFDVKSKKIRPINLDRTVRKCISLSDGECALALADGLAFLDVNENWRAVDKGIFKERSNALYEESPGKLWVGTNSGLFLWQNDSIKSFQELNTPEKIRVSDILKWKDYLVLATRSSGIVFFRDGKKVVVTEKDGLISNTVDCIELDAQNNIWIGTASGLQRLSIDDPEQLQWHFFRVNYQKGLPSNEVNDVLFANSFLYVATNGGLCVIQPDAASFQSTSAEVVIDLFMEGERELNVNEIPELNFDQNNIRIGFLSLNYRTGDHTIYRYRLSGLHDDWVQTDNRAAFFWSLPAGTFVFEVCAMNEDGAWGNPKSVSFSIKKHFTESWWFRSLSVLIVLLLIVCGFYLFYRNKRRKFLNRAKMSELKQQALNANMNPHFIYNALGSIQHFINTGKPEEANEYLSDFSRLIRMNLETNKESLVSLADELERLELYLKLEKLRFGEKLEFHIQIQSGLNALELEIPPMLLQPYVENALIHGILPSGYDGLLFIEVCSVGSTSYQITIKDNGVGIARAHATRKSQHESLALKMNEERMRILSEQTGEHFEVEIRDLSELGMGENGTQILLILPAG